KEFLRIRPDIPIVLITGFSQLVSKENVLEIGIKEYITKPIDPYSFSKKIRDVLDLKDS
ncbi:MAG: two-component system cell cycle sensor histidine kinase/response regulator CckA, partial [bacterium]